MNVRPNRSGRRSRCSDGVLLILTQELLEFAQRYILWHDAQDDTSGARGSVEKAV